MRFECGLYWHSVSTVRALILCQCPCTLKKTKYFVLHGYPDPLPPIVSLLSEFCFFPFEVSVAPPLPVSICLFYYSLNYSMLFQSMVMLSFILGTYTNLIYYNQQVENRLRNNRQRLSFRPGFGLNRIQMMNTDFR